MYVKGHQSCKMKQMNQLKPCHVTINQSEHFKLEIYNGKLISK